jgi:RNA polymerase sigma factor (TIGR02999 family)
LTEQTRTTTVSRLVAALANGDPQALDALFPIVYDEIHALAHRQRMRWRGDDTLNTTALVHEAWIRLADRERLGVEGRSHFMALAAVAMRRILINYAESRRALKRGGDVRQVSLSNVQVADPDGLSGTDADILIELDAALSELAGVHERQASIVECRFFGGMTVEETAEALDVSPRTVKRDWAVAQAWLHNRVEQRAGKWK